MKIKKLAQIQAATIILAAACMDMTTIGPAAGAYVGYSFIAWVVLYPLYYLLGEPGWE